MEEKIYTEIVLLENIDGMFSRYYEKTENVENLPLNEQQKEEYKEMKEKISILTEEQYKKYIKIREDVKEINRDFGEIYVLKKIAGITYKSTRIIKIEDFENKSYVEFKKEYDEKIKKAKYFIIIYKMLILEFKIKNDPLLDELEIQLVDVLDIENNLLNRELDNTLNRMLKLEMKYEEERKRKKEDERNILNSMGIFLSIFSVIGLGVSTILNIENNHFAIWSMICGIILITMASLFFMINFETKIDKEEKSGNKTANNDKKQREEKFLIFKKISFPFIVGVILVFLGGIVINFFPTKNRILREIEIKIEKLEEKNNELEKRLDYEKRINELENKTK